MKKTEILDLSFNYAAGAVDIDGKCYNLIASEERGGKAYLINPEDYSYQKIWDGPGGVMGMVGINDREFLSIDEFYPVFQSADAAVYSTKIEGNGPYTFQKTKLFDLPWCHRVTGAKEADGTFIVAASLCKVKAFVDDWSTKGSVYAYSYQNGVLGEAENILPETLLKNHAMWVQKNTEGYDDIYVGGSEGTFRLYREDGVWKNEQILANPTSDIAVGDFDNDGEEEIAIIEGFHGGKMKVFKKIANELKEMDSVEFEFGHVLWGGELNGKKRIILGTRGGEKFLRVYSFDGKTLKLEEEDMGVSPAQVMVSKIKGQDVVLAACHGINKVNSYIF